MRGELEKMEKKPKKLGVNSNDNCKNEGENDAPDDSTVIDCHLKQLTRCLSSNHNNNKILDRKDGRPSITLLHVARSFFQIKMLTTEQELSVQILLIYHTCHHLKQTKCGISQHSNLCH